MSKTISTEGNLVLRTTGGSIDIQTDVGSTNFANDVTVTGNLTITGSTATSSDTAITDRIVTLNDGELGAGVSLRYSGVEIDRGTLDNALLVFDENDDNLYFSTDAGSTYSLVLLEGEALQNVVEDTTPQLGGNLDVNGNSIVSVSNGNITIQPDGTGQIVMNKVDINSGAIDGTTIGSSTPSTAAFTTLSTSSTTTLAGATLSDDLTFTNATPNIIGGDTDGRLLITSNATSTGSNIILYGDTESSSANDFVVRAGGTEVLRYDHSATTWDFQANTVTTTGVLNAGSASITGDLTVDTNTLYVDSADNRVGIGTTNPLDLLHVSSSSSTRVKIESTAVSTFPGVEINTTTREWQIAADQTNEKFYIYDATATATRFLIDQNGNIGIGTATPSRELEVVGDILISGSTTPALFLENSGTTGANRIYFGDSDSLTRGQIYYDHSDDSFVINTAGGDRVSVASDGITTFNNDVIMGGNLYGEADTGAVFFSGGTSTNSGSNIILYGATNATNARDIFFRADTTTVYQYDHSATTHAFTGAVTVTDFDGTNIPPKYTVEAESATFTILATEQGKLFNCTSTFTATLPDEGDASLYNGWAIVMKNSGSGTITIDTAGTATIDGQTSVTLNPGESNQIIFDGSNYLII